ncbi:MAG: flagellin [bacterium]|nr:flagellin [bacterium]
MRIVHNVPAINSQRNLSSTNRALAKNLERMSSGLRINRASDDAAGLAIAQRVDSQVLGLEQGTRNLLDGISVVQTAEAGMQEIQAMLQRMRVLAIEAANGSLSPDQREMVQAEVDQLLESVNQQADAVEFNAMKLLTGNFSETAPWTWKASRSSGEQVTDSGSTIDIYAKFSEAGFETANGTAMTPGGYVMVNAAVFSIMDYDSVNDFMRAINESVQANATISYDIINDRFTIASDTPGEVLRLADMNSGGNYGFFQLVNIDIGVLTPPPGPTSMAISQYEGADESGMPVGTQNTRIIDLTKNFTAQKGGFDHDVNGSFRINGVTFSVSDYATIDEMMNAINNNKKADVTITYSRNWDEFIVASRTEGRDLVLSAISGTNNFLYETEILDDEGHTQNADGSYNGSFMNQSNTFRAPMPNAIAESIYEVRMDDTETVNTTREILNKDKVNLNYGAVYDDDGRKLSRVSQTGAGEDSRYSVAWRGGVFGSGDGSGSAPTGDYPNDTYHNFDQYITGNITINDATFSIAKYDTVNELISAINASQAAKATMGYDTIADKFWIRADNLQDDLFIAESRSTSGFGFFEQVNIIAGPTGTTYQADGFTNPDWRKEGLIFHVGANEDQVVVTHISTVSTQALKIDVLEENGVTNTFAAESAIRLLSDAIDRISMQRSDLGAIQNRMEHRLNYNEIAHENQTASLSRIRDLDFAAESTVFVRNQILLNSSTAMLAQANTIPQNVLSLIS